jgi:hypothetical protein
MKITADVRKYAEENGYTGDDLSKRELVDSTASE